MSRKRKKKEDPDNPDTWDIVADSQELGDFYPTDFDIVSETQDPDDEKSLNQGLSALTVAEARRERSPGQRLSRRRTRRRRRDRQTAATKVTRYDFGEGVQEGKRLLQCGLPTRLDLFGLSSLRGDRA
ncbi:hypothetical protein Pcac1_g14698 [Phytophthora cactorum]|nr:hypothetical protein Pcac1_g14698 [Phytophthora cactorum]